MARRRRDSINRLLPSRRNVLIRPVLFLTVALSGIVVGTVAEVHTSATGVAATPDAAMTIDARTQQT